MVLFRGMARKRRSKRNRESIYPFKSQFEKHFSEYLNGIGVSYMYEGITIPYTVPVKHRKYTPDFIIDPKSRRRITSPDLKCLTDLEGKIIIETKGRLTVSDRNKMMYVKQHNPTLDIRFVFMQDNYIAKGSKTKYSMWCEANGFQYHIGKQVPKEWFR